MLIDDYRAGHCADVWQRLRELGEAVRDEQHLTDALAVAHETMTRVSQNIAILRDRLPEIGYEFDDPSQAHLPPTSDTAKLVTEIEDAIGPMPIAFRAFYEIVGSVNFCQSLDQHIEELGMDRENAPEINLLGERDPLYVVPLEKLRADLVQSLESDKQRGHLCRFNWRSEGPDKWYCQFAPDEFHKANYSGGENYNLFIPDLAADFRIRDCFLGEYDTEEEDREWFISNLRNTMLGGGFRGVQRNSDWKRVPPSSPLIDKLKHDLVPL